jgi:hypothetical protein
MIHLGQEFVQTMQNYDQFIHTGRKVTKQQKIQDHISALGHGVISRALDARHLIAVFAYKVNATPIPGMDAASSGNALKHFDSILKTASINPDGLLGALVRVRLQQALMTIHDTAEFMDDSYGESQKFWTELQSHLHKVLQANIFTADLDVGIVLYRIKFGLKLQSSTKQKLAAPVTVQLARTHRGGVHKNCFMIVPGSCSGNEVACTHLKTMYWSQGKTAWACGENMHNHVEFAKFNQTSRINAVYRKYKEKVANLLKIDINNRQALSRGADDDFLQQIATKEEMEKINKDLASQKESEEVKVMDEESLDNKGYESEDSWDKNAKKVNRFVQKYKNIMARKSQAPERQREQSESSKFESKMHRESDFYNKSEESDFAAETLRDLGSYVNTEYYVPERESQTSIISKLRINLKEKLQKLRNTDKPSRSKADEEYFKPAVQSQNGSWAIDTDNGSFPEPVRSSINTYEN